jgi:hypothetical protein
VLQALLLFLVTLSTAHIINPSDFKKDEFYKKMAERLNPPAPPGAAKGGGPAAVDEFELVTEENKNQQQNLGTQAPATEAFKPKEKSSGLLMGTLFRVAVFFEFAQSIEDSTDPGEGQAPFANTRSRALGIAFTVMLLKLGALLATAAVGIAIGLTISAIVRTETQAVMRVPLVLIPQILFGGFVVTRPEMSTSVRVASQLVPSFCAQRLMDVGGLYGQTTPRMTNRTKYPVFLTPTGEQEDITWTEAGKEYTEKYDKVSDWNVSWQNLVVFPNHVGEHHNAFRIQRGVKKYDESTEQRNDVRYPMGTLFQFTGPAWSSLFMLLGWIIACYGVTVWGLVGKQKGK